MAKKIAAEVEPIRSSGELAKLVNRNKGTVSRWLGRDDWTFGKPPWPRRLVPDILRWAAGHLRDRSDVDAVGDPPRKEKQAKPGDDNVYTLKEKKLAAEVRKLEAQADQAQAALARERGELIDASEAETEWGRIGAAVRDGFENLPSQLVGLALNHGMPQPAAPAYHAQIVSAIATVLQKLSNGSDDDESPEEPDDRST